MEYVLNQPSRYLQMIQNHPAWSIGGIYQGYMYMSYFPIANEELKRHGLKLAVVYLHDKNIFEIWLSSKNRKVMEEKRKLFDSKTLAQQGLFHDPANKDAIIEYVLVQNPDFECAEALASEIQDKIDWFYEFVAGQIG